MVHCGQRGKSQWIEPLAHGSGNVEKKPLLAASSEQAELQGDILQVQTST